jgi:hypothetical protein
MAVGYSNGAIRYFTIPAEGLLGAKGRKVNDRDRLTVHMISYKTFCPSYRCLFAAESWLSRVLRGETDRQVMDLSDEDIDEGKECTISS